MRNLTRIVDAMTRWALPEGCVEKAWVSEKWRSYIQYAMKYDRAWFFYMEIWAWDRDWIPLGYEMT